MQRLKKLQLTFISLTVALLCEGCVLGYLGTHYVTRHSKDVSEHPRYWGGYEPGAEYRLERDTGLENALDIYRKKVLSTIRRTDEDKYLGGMLYGAPAPEEYEAAPDKWPELIGFVPAGTIIRVSDIRLEGSAVTGGDIVAVYAEIASGEFAGTRVDISDLSKTVDESEDPEEVFPQRPDPKLLTRVNQTPVANMMRSHQPAAGAP